MKEATDITQDNDRVAFTEKLCFFSHLDENWQMYYWTELLVLLYRKFHALLALFVLLDFPALSLICML